MKKIYRSKTDRKLAGVCGGIAKYANLDSNIIRILCVVAALLSAGAAILAYIACVLILPEDDMIIDAN